jgi:hypothetical protein
LEKILAQEEQGYCELKHHKQEFDEECSKLCGRKKHAKGEWSQHANELKDERNLRNVRREAI